MGTHPIFESDFDCLTESMEEIDETQLIGNLVLAAICHPNRQARILMQLGHEPGPTIFKKRQGMGLWSSAGEYRPGVLTGYLQQSGILKDGNTSNLARGLPMSLCEVVSSTLTQTAVTPMVTEKFPKNEKDDSYSQVVVDAIRESLIKSAGVIVANPFRVMALRQMASIAGDKSIKPFVTMAKEGDFFAGLFPRLLCEVSCIFISKSLIHLFRNNIGTEDDANRKIGEAVIQYATSTFLYPLQLISSIQSVSGTGMILDSYPELNWLQILAELRSLGEAQRGASTLFNRRVPVSKKAYHEEPVSIEAPEVTAVPEAPVTPIVPVVEVPVVTSIPQELVVTHVDETATEHGAKE